MEDSVTKIDTELVEYNLTEMARALAATNDPQLIHNFMYSLFTVAEADEIAKRWALVKRIAEGETQRAIASELGLSLCKITRGSRELKKQDSPFRKMLEVAGYDVQDKRERRRSSGKVK